MDDVLSSFLSSIAIIRDRIERYKNEVDLVVEAESEVKKLKIYNVSEIKERIVLKFIETQSLLSECSFCFIYPSKIHQMSNNVMIYERCYYHCDLKSIIYTKCLSLSEISSIMIKLSNILMILCECDISVSNVKSSNIIYENNEVKLVDLCLNELRSSEETRMDDIIYTSPEELSGAESNEKNVIWSIGCILYEMLNKELPFKEDNDVFKTLNNIMRCKLNDDIKVDYDDEMIEILLRMLKVGNEDRLSLIEFKKEMMKENEILKDSENNVMIIKERKEILFNNDYSVVTLPIIYPCECYLKSERWEEIRDDLIEKYNNKPNERYLTILLMMKIYKEDYTIKEKLKFQIHHQYKERKEECILDEMIFNIHNDYQNRKSISINSDCICFCEEGFRYLFKILKEIDGRKLDFNINVPIQFQSLFGLFFSQLSNLQELELFGCNITPQFLESFIQLIPLMKKLKFVNLAYNPIGPTGFKLLLPYLHLLIDENNELNLFAMDLNDESMILLSTELFKYPNLERINISFNINIHSIGLKYLISKFPISKIQISIDDRNNKGIVINKDMKELVEI